MTTGAPVECRSVSKRYPAGAVALHEIDLRCESGEITVLVGPSGCGKTTLLRCIAGLEPVTSGTIHIGGADVTTVEPHRRGVAMVFQNYALYPNKTVAQNIGFPLRMGKVARAERAARVAEIAEVLQIGHLLGRRPRELSGGQKQRVGIGRALVRQPRLVAMDEPLSNLDAQLRTEMRAEIRALQRRLGMTVTYVTHDQTEALGLADKLIVLNDGRVEQAAAPEAAFSAPATTFVASFLGAMNLLTGSVTATGLRLDGPGGCVLPLPAGFAPASGAARLSLGIRPEHLRAGNPPAGRWSVTGQVVSSELLGTERLVRVRCGPGAGSQLRVRMPADQPAAGELTVWAPDQHLHVFDASGARVAGPARTSVTLGQVSLWPPPPA